MSRTQWGRISSGLTLLLLACFAMPSPLQAEDEKPKAKEKDKAKSSQGLQGYYAIIASELQLSEDQKKTLTASLASREQAMKKWDEENGAKVQELTAAQQKAKEAGDTAAAKLAGDELKKLKAARAVLEDEGKAKLRAVLTPEQVSHLHGYNLYVGAMVRFSKAELTDGQKVRAKAMALEAGKPLAADVGDEDLDKAKLELASRIEKELLTAAQIEVMAKAAADKAKPKSKASEKSKTDEKTE